MPRNTGKRVMAKNTGRGSRYAAEQLKHRRDWKNDMQPEYAMIEDWGGYPTPKKKSLIDRILDWWG